MNSIKIELESYKKIFKVKEEELNNITKQGQILAQQKDSVMSQLIECQGSIKALEKVLNPLPVKPQAKIPSGKNKERKND